MSNRWQRFKESYFLHSFKNDRVAIASFTVLVFLLLVSLTAALIAPHDPYDPESIDIMNADLYSEDGYDR